MDPGADTPGNTPGVLLDAVVSITADLSLDSVLARIVEAASSLADARYAALGVLGTTPGQRLRTFVTHGLTPGERAQIGDLPHGLGLLGLIIDHPEPLRLHDIAEHPASYGFPPHHPPMSSFLGVPIRSREVVFGNLYLTEKMGGDDFTQDDEDVVVALAAAAGVAIENARLYEEAARRERWLAANAEITALLSTSPPGADALQAVADRAREVAAADVSWIVAGHDVENLTLRVVSGADLEAGAGAGVHLGESLAARVVRTGEVILAESLTASQPAASPGWPALGSAVVVPMRSRAGVEGALALAWTWDHTEAAHALDAALPASFAEHAALALQMTQARDDQERLVVYEDRDRIARDMHDLVIQRLFAVGMSLQGAAKIADQGGAGVAARLETAVDDLDATIRDIRRTIFALGSMDTAADIQTEVTRLVDRAAGTLKFRPVLRFEGPVRSLVDEDLAPDVLAVLGEALSNASRHADASSVQVLFAAGDSVVLTVSDDGRGLPSEVTESGLGNMRRRAEARGGSLVITSGPDSGTRLVWSVPSAARAHATAERAEGAAGHGT